MAFDGFLIAAAGSGSGKTMITCGLLRLLTRKGMAVESFKCGPDYIDPMFHSRILGVACRNLDPYFTDEETLRFLYAKNQETRQLAVAEGVMGYYDGIGGTSLSGSSWQVASVLDLPVILVVSCRGMSLSAAAIVKGFLEFQKPSGIAGVILNQASGRMFPAMKKAVEAACGIPVLGYVPVKKELAVESRHLGLVTPDQVADLQKRMDALADVLEETLDLERLLQIAQGACRGSWEPDRKPPQNPLARLEQNRLDQVKQGRVRLAVAKDEAFCFSYQDNWNLLEELGAELVFFSPLRDPSVPEAVDGLWLPGGYPELYARELSENRSMLASVRAAVADQMPVLAECGGFLYLHEQLEDGEKTVWNMAGVIPGMAYPTGRLGRFGYVELTARRDQLLLFAGGRLRAHEFHYWDSPCCGDSCHAKKASGLGEWDCVNGSKRLYAGFPHVYCYGNPEAALCLLEQCLNYRKEREHRNRGSAGQRDKYRELKMEKELREEIEGQDL